MNTFYGKFNKKKKKRIDDRFIIKNGDDNRFIFNIGYY